MMLDRVLTAGRVAAEALMVDEVHLYRPGEDVLDRNTGETVPGPPVVDFYTGPARVRPETTMGRETQAGEQAITLRAFVVSLPWNAALPAGERPVPGDVVDVTTSPDARLVGLRLWVTGVQYGASATAWRLSVEDRS